MSSYMDRLRSELAGCESVLDLGCGKSSPLKHLSISHTVGVDVWPADLAEAEAAGTHSRYLLGDVREMEISETVDAVLMVELIEHMPVEEGRKLLARATKWATKKVVLTTPDGFLDTGHVPEGANHYLEHKAGWTSEMLEAEGFEVSLFVEAYGLAGVDMLLAVKNL